MINYIEIMIVIFLLLMISGAIIGLFIILNNQNITVNKYIDIQKEIAKEMDANNSMIAFKSYMDIMKEKDDI